jgi:predicted metalloprotease with PDZ domain
VSYSLKYDQAKNAQVHVRIELMPPKAGPQTLVMPHAIPMGYGGQPYDRFLVDVRAHTDAGSELPVKREEGPRWMVGRLGARVASVEYEVDLAQMERDVLSGGDSSKARPGYVGLLGYSVFAYFEGLEEWPVDLRVDGPKEWPVLLTLAPNAPPARGSTVAWVENFYALADSQIVMGPAVVYERLEGTVPLFVATYAEGVTDPHLLGKLGLDAMERVIAYFGGAPFRHYTIVQEFLKPISSLHQYSLSMEHLESGTFTLDFNGSITATSSESERARAYFTFAHHIAHAWIPKRAYGEGYFPFCWELAPVLDSIWFSEGFAQFAAIDALADALPEAKGRALREQLIEMRFRRNLAELPVFLRRMPLVEVSRVASTRYGEDWRTGRTVFARGGLMAAEMDQKIREQSKGTKRLRDALRHLMEWSAKEKRAFRIEELPRIFKEATGAETGDILEKWLRPMQE